MWPFWHKHLPLFKNRVRHGILLRIPFHRAWKPPSKRAGAHRGSTAPSIHPQRSPTPHLVRRSMFFRRSVFFRRCMLFCCSMHSGAACYSGLHLLVEKLRMFSKRGLLRLPQSSQGPPRRSWGGIGMAAGATGRLGPFRGGIGMEAGATWVHWGPGAGLAWPRR